MQRPRTPMLRQERLDLPSMFALLCSDKASQDFALARPPLLRMTCFALLHTTG